jgi:hypothetical protein
MKTNSVTNKADTDKANKADADKADKADHPLANKWRWSYKPTIVYKQQTAEDWLADYRPVLEAPIDSVETFWRVYANVPTLSTLDCGNIYALFRDNITASWEDKANEDGFSVVMYMNKYITPEYMKKLYQHSLFVTIGSNAPFASELNGCTFERKVGGNKIAFWMRTNTSNVKDQLQTAMSIINALNIPFNDVVNIDDELRIDWKDPKLSTQKITVKCVSHKKRATEPMVPRTRYPTGPNGPNGPNGHANSHGPNGPNGRSGPSRYTSKPNRK